VSTDLPMLEVVSIVHPPNETSLRNFHLGQRQVSIDNITRSGR
jgi:hypothetical protein